MGKLRRYYNQNRKTIWGIIIIIAFAFALLRLANYFAKKQNEQAIQNAILQQTNVVTSEQNANAQSNTIQSNNSIQANSKTAETEAIKKFVSYCNKKELENAYNMITDDCKRQMFNDLETFEKIYYNSAFENKSKEISIDIWSNHTYMVYFRENALATGKITDENQRGDYITVVKDNEDNYKLNINSYIGYKKINQVKENQNLKTEVVCKNIYLNYEEYKIIITNKTNQDIKLDSLDNAESIYLEDSNSMRYPSYNHELSQELLTISGGHTRELNIKFYNSYVSDRIIKSLNFSDLRINNEKMKYKIEL